MTRKPFRLSTEELEARIPLDVSLLLTTDGPLIVDPGDDLTDAMLIQTVNQSIQTDLDDNMAGWQTSLRIMPLAGATGTIGFNTVTEPPSYVFSSISNLGLGTSISTTTSDDDSAFAYDVNFPFTGGVQIPTSSVNLVQVDFNVSPGASGEFGVFAVGGLGVTEWASAGLAAKTFSNAGGGLTEIGRIIVVSPATVAQVEFSVTAAADSEAGGGNFPQLLVHGEVTVTESVEFEVTGGNATLGTDFTLATTVSIPAGQYDGTTATAVPIDLSILNEDLVELNETVQIGFSGASEGLEVGDADGADGIEDTHNYTITNDDSASITLASASANESTGQLDFAVSLSNPVDTTVTVEFDTLTTGDATMGVDFSPITNQIVSFSAGSTATQTVTVSVVDDGIAEFSETAVAQIDSLDAGATPRNVSIGTASATGTILDDDTDPPVVGDVLLSGSGWNSNVSQFSLVNGEDPQAPLPWLSLDTIAVRFNKNVDVSPQSLTLVGANQPQYSPAGFNYSPESFTATWTFSAFTSAERFLINLAGESQDSNPIDDRVGPGGTLLNGGSDYVVRFDVLPGDTGRDGTISEADLPASRMRATVGPPASPNYAARFDVNGDGAISVTDLVNVGANFGNTLPAGEPSLPQAMLVASISTNGDFVGPLEASELRAIADEAVSRWRDAGVTLEEHDQL